MFLVSIEGPSPGHGSGRFGDQVTGLIDKLIFRHERNGRLAYEAGAIMRLVEGLERSDEAASQRLWALLGFADIAKFNSRVYSGGVF